MSNTNYKIPNRTKKVEDLILMIALNTKDWQDGDRSAEKTNLILAMCEVAMSTPTYWYAEQEQKMILLTVKALYGDPSKFISDLRDDSVSFYSKFAQEAGLPHNDLLYVIDRLHALHDKEFGKPTIY